MFVTPDSHILFYVFIALIVGAGLFFSRSQGSSFRSYFFADLSAGSSVVGATLFIVTFLAAFALSLPTIPAGSYLIGSPFIIVLASAFPLFLFAAPSVSAEHFHSSLGKKARKFIGLHGLIFVAVIQMLVLLRATDFLLSQFLPGTYFGIQVVMLVGAGIYTLIGGLNAVFYVNLLVGSGAAATLLYMVVNAMFLHQPLMFSFHSLFAVGSDVFKLSGTTESNMFVTASGIALAMLWVTHLELGSIFRQASIRSHSVKKRGTFIAIAVFFITGYGAMFFPDFGVVTETGFVRSYTLANSLVVLGLFGALLGMFALSFQSISVIVAMEFSGEHREPETDEKKILIGRLSTVVAVILSILMVSFGKIYGNRVVEWYVLFLAFFSTPIASVFLLSLVMKKGKQMGLLIGLAAGEGFALIEFLFLNGRFQSLITGSSSAFAFSLDIAVMTLCTGVAAGIIMELAFFQKIMLMTGFGRPVKRV